MTETLSGVSYALCIIGITLVVVGLIIGAFNSI